MFRLTTILSEAYNVYFFSLAIIDVMKRDEKIKSQNTWQLGEVLQDI